MGASPPGLVVVVVVVVAHCGGAWWCRWCGSKVIWVFSYPYDSMGTQRGMLALYPTAQPPPPPVPPAAHACNALSSSRTARLHLSYYSSLPRSSYAHSARRLLAATSLRRELLPPAPVHCSCCFFGRKPSQLSSSALTSGGVFPAKPMS